MKSHENNMSVISSAGCAVDPPWENKSVSRGSRYPMLPSRRLLGLPIGRLLHPVRASPRAYERASAGRSASSHATAWVLSRTFTVAAAHARRLLLAGAWDAERTGCLGGILHHGATRSFEVTHTDNCTGALRVVGV